MCLFCSDQHFHIFGDNEFYTIFSSVKNPTLHILSVIGDSYMNLVAADDTTFLVAAVWLTQQYMYLYLCVYKSIKIYLFIYIYVDAYVDSYQSKYKISINADRKVHSPSRNRVIRIWFYQERVVSACRADKLPSPKSEWVTKFIRCPEPVSCFPNKLAVVSIVPDTGVVC